MKKFLLNNFNVIDNYAMSTGYSIQSLKKLRNTDGVELQLVKKGLINLEQNKFNIPDCLDIKDIELLIDFYIGTIINGLTVDELKENIFEIELPQEFEKIAGIFNTLQIDLKYENMFFSTKLTNYNQLVLCYIGTEISSDDMICFNISVVK